MGWNFRKSFKLGKHAKVNVGKKGISTSFKFGNLTINPKRKKYTVRTPIKGLFYTGSLKKKK